MEPTRRQLMLIVLFVISSCFPSYSVSSSSANPCSMYVFSNRNTYQSCVQLPALNSYLHWNFDVSSRNLEVAYRHVNVTQSIWVAWGLNPNFKGMVGTQAFVAFQKADGNMKVYNLPITSYGTKMQPGELSFNVSSLSSFYLSNEIIIFASLILPYNYTTVNQVWQDGPILNDAPAMHKVTGPNVQSMATLDLLSGQYTKTRTRSVNPRMKLKISHGIINTISWGMMMPLGALIARYLKVFKSSNRLWFYMHVTCQTSGYIIGVAGFTTGILLGNFSPGLTYTIHQIVGIMLFSLASLQVLSLFFRPKPDHKYRAWWKAYHYLVGYTTIVLSIYNIFKGFSILKPNKTLENAYIGYILGLSSASVILEVYTWIIVFKRRCSMGITKGGKDITNEEGRSSSIHGEDLV